MKRHLFIAISLLVILMMLLTSCTGSPTQPAATSTTAPTKAPEKVDLTAWLLTQTTEMKAVMDQFGTAYPNYNLKITEFASEDYKTQTRVALSSGTAPDVLETNVGALLNEFIDAGYVMDITDAAKAKDWYSRIYPDFVDSMSKDNKLYAINVSGVFLWQAMFYNKTFTDKNNITVPNEMTIDQFIEISKKIKDAGMQPIAFGNKDMWPGIIMFGDYMLQSVAPSYIDKVNSGEVKWTDSAELKTTFETLQKVGTSGILTVGYESQDHLAAINSWLGQKCAFLYNGTWWTQVLKNGLSDVPFTIGTTSLPLISSDTKLKGTQFWASMAMFINSKTKVKDAAVDFVDYYTSDAMATAQGKDQGTYTFSPKINETLKLADIFVSEPYAKQLSLPKMNYADWAFPTPVIEALKVQIVGLLSGKISVEDALAAIEKVHAAERK